MPESLEELVSEPGIDRLVLPRNPLQPPDIIPQSVTEGFGAFMQGPSQEGIARRSQPSAELQERMKKGVEGTIDWAKVPGRAYRGEVTPEEEIQWGAKTATGIVFDPVPAVMTRLAAPAGTYALRNLQAAGKLTPIEHNPFITEPVLGSGASGSIRNSAALANSEKDTLKALADKSMLTALSPQELAQFEALRAKNIASRTAAPAQEKTGVGNDVLATIRVVADEIAKESGGIGTVYIGDIVNKTGLSIKQVQEAVSQAAARGEAVLATSSSTRALAANPGRKEAAIVTDSANPFHTVTFNKP